MYTLQLFYFISYEEFSALINHLYICTYIGTRKESEVSIRTECEPCICYAYALGKESMVSPSTASIKNIFQMMDGPKKHTIC